LTTNEKFVENMTRWMEPAVAGDPSQRNPNRTPVAQIVRAKCLIAMNGLLYPGVLQARCRSDGPNGVDNRGDAVTRGRCDCGIVPVRQSPGGHDMALKIGDIAPDFEADTTEGRIRFHDWIGDSWAVLFSHPKDFTPVCTTELGYMAKLKPEFEKRHTKVIGLSVDPVDSHARWATDIRETQGYAPNFPMIGDPTLAVSKLYGMLPNELEGTCDGRTAADNQTVRNVFVIGPDKKIKLLIVYPMTTGRNFDEVLRVIDSLQLTAKHKVATPVNWKPGDDVIIAGSVSDDEAKQKYPQGWKAPRPYLRIVPPPTS
jgi:alkyl hydroperoxide reductase subunit AhpC